MRIVAQLADDEADRRANRETGGAEGPTAADVAQVVDGEVDAAEADQHREDDPGDDDQGGAPHPGAQAVRADGAGACLFSAGLRIRVTKVIRQISAAIPKRTYWCPILARPKAIIDADCGAIG